MKDVNDLFGKMQHERIVEPEVQSENQLGDIINTVFKQLGQIYPAWKTSYGAGDQIEGVKAQWVKAFAENGVTTIEHLQAGFKAARQDESGFIPTVGKFCKWCQGGGDEDEAFDNFISHAEPKDYAEKLTRHKVGYKCRNQLPEDRARKLWCETLRRVRKEVADGKHKQADVYRKKIESPEVVKENLTPEQRNQQLDYAIDNMLASGTRLIGPYKIRYEERKKLKVGN